MFVTPREQVTTEMDFLQSCLVQELPKLPHPLLVQTPIVLFL
jgi:hypothetical protein